MLFVRPRKTLTRLRLVTCLVAFGFVILFFASDCVRDCIGDECIVSVIPLSWGRPTSASYPVHSHTHVICVCMCVCVCACAKALATVVMSAVPIVLAAITHSLSVIINVRTENIVGRGMGLGT